MTLPKVGEFYNRGLFGNSISLLIRFWLHKKCWRISCKFQFEITRNKEAFRKNCLTKLIWIASSDIDQDLHFSHELIWLYDEQGCIKRKNNLLKVCHKFMVGLRLRIIVRVAAFSCVMFIIIKWKVLMREKTHNSSLISPSIQISSIFLCPPDKIWGAYCFCPVCLSVCLFVCLFVWEQL